MPWFSPGSILGELRVTSQTRGQASLPRDSTHLDRQTELASGSAVGPSGGRAGTQAKSGFDFLRGQPASRTQSS